MCFGWQTAGTPAGPYLLTEEYADNLEEDEGHAAFVADGPMKDDRAEMARLTSNIRIEQSAPPEARAVPSELKDTEFTESVCPCMTAKCLPVPISHTHTDPASVPPANKLAAPTVVAIEDIATQLRGEGLPEKRRTHFPDLRSQSLAVLSSALVAMRVAFSCQHTAVTSLVWPVKSLRGAVRSVLYTEAVIACKYALCSIPLERAVEENHLSQK